MTESQAVTNLKNKLAKYGLFWKSSDRFVAGIPDVIGCVDGTFVCIEVKRDSGKPTKLQEFFLGRVGISGGVGLVATYSNKTKAWRIDKSKIQYEIEEVVDEVLRRVKERRAV